MTQVQIIPGNFTITDPTWPIYNIRRVITSDDFSGSGELVGAMTSAALGGTPMTWDGVAGGWTRHQGAIRSPQENYNHNLILGGLPADIFIGFRMVSLPDTGRLVVSARASTSSDTRIMLRVISDGSVQFEQRIGGTITTSSIKYGAVANGDHVGFEVRGSQVSALVNQREVLTWETGVTAAGQIVLSTYPINTSVIDDLTVAEAL